MPRISADNVTASAPIEQSLNNLPANTPSDNDRSKEGRAPSPTYTQMAARPPSPRMRGGATKETFQRSAMVDNTPALPPPMPLTIGSPAEAPFTQRTTALSEDDNLGWTTFTAPTKSKKSKPKKGKGKAKEVTPVPLQKGPVLGLATPDASPKGSKPRKHRCTDCSNEGLVTGKQQEAPVSLLLSSKSPLVFGRSSPSPLSSAKAASLSDHKPHNEGSEMDIDPAEDAGLDSFGRPTLFLQNASAGWESPQNSYYGDLEHHEPGPSSHPSKGHKRSAARHDLESMIEAPISRYTAMNAEAATGQLREDVDTCRPAPHPRQQISSDEQMLPASNISVQSDSTKPKVTPRKPAVHHNHGRYSMAAIGNPPLTPYNIILADPDIMVPPEGLLKKTQGDRVNWEKKGLAPKQVKVWNNLGRDNPFIVVQFGELRAEHAGMNERAVFLYSLLTCLSERTDIRVNPGHSPLEEKEYNNNKDAPPNVEPFWIGIKNLPKEWCLVLARAAWLHAGNHILNFVLWRNDLPTLCAAFRSVFRFRALLKEDSELQEITVNILLRDIGKGGRRRAVQDDAFGAILDSVDVEVHNCRITPHTSEDVAFIHITSPTADWQDWVLFRNAIQAHGFGSLTAGHRVAFKTRVFCGFCHSIGHPIGRCPVKGFFLPQKMQLQKQPTAQPLSSGRGEHQGGRGHGNGRSCGGRGGKTRGY
ncbi:uncharacterized protein C8Q71DRAFT_725814 [Rhodofomes roseus]|uniref:Uncharacterized protein n=1 Tax=Rhodofomes roseus TaxID=34475 RepID=A0ABQ8K7G0_9APHY|nr:uncharacterized protein C8Q71DRAFT_725814 [Rhodofomes roseus]KAH9833138.1 hypothetical protein C8Q71DRAFT_725814 [Rhodofomes roseus]